MPCRPPCNQVLSSENIYVPELSSNAQPDMVETSGSLWTIYVFNNTESLGVLRQRQIGLVTCNGVLEEEWLKRLTVRTEFNMLSRFCWVGDSM